MHWPKFPVAMLFKAWICGRWLLVVTGSNPPGLQMYVFYEYCVLLGSGFGGDPTNRPEESYRVWCV
jgi:hypothetical protein